VAVAVAFLFAVSVLFIVIRWFERTVTFHAAKIAPGEVQDVPPGAEDVWLTTSDGVRLHGWKFEPSTNTAKASVIYFHGNGGNITNVAWVGERLAGRGLEVLLFDYRGYGRSEGSLRDENELYRDADAASRNVRASARQMC